ncbi:hypothetical protein [Pseudonocardia zijingensis]|jgi:hypothetical protein|uniref:DUF3817 domain-containing protein n=1 Tax=Pseudonocardia zijingensis TaxID=153376 RepID=A0ABN1PMC5_9PSEU
MSTRLLAVLAGIEFGTLVVLLANLATVHVAVVPTILGPLHGCAYLAAVVGTAVRAGLLSRPALLSVIPGVGATLAVAVLRRRARAGAAQS